MISRIYFIKFARLYWSYTTKKFEYLKESTKNGEISYASMNLRLEEIMRR